MNVFAGLQSFEATSYSVHNLVLCVCSVIPVTVTFASFGLENIPYLSRELSQFL
jgi:hypothetical protein